jgi:hypothetical protein
MPSSTITINHIEHLKKNNWSIITQQLGDVCENMMTFELNTKTKAQQTQ